MKILLVAIRKAVDLSNILPFAIWIDFELMNGIYLLLGQIQADDHVFIAVEIGYVLSE